jgi:hypothetical protein
MIFGFNTDVPARDSVYHVQTEDRGAKNPVIESIIYVGGKIVGRRRTPYAEAEDKERIEDMVRRQHKDLVEAIRAGTWTPADGAPSAAAAPASAAQGYVIELLNPNEVRHGEYLRFCLAVKDRTQSPASAVALEVRWLLDGAEAERQSLLSKADGAAEVWFPAPADRMYATLLVCAQGAAGREFAKFHVRGSQSG